MDDKKVLLQTTFSYEEVEKIALDIMNLGMVLRQDQLNGYCDKSGNDVAQEYLQQFWGIKEKNQPDRGSCSECGEGYDNDEEWLYNTKCAVCGHSIPAHLIIEEPAMNIYALAGHKVKCSVAENGSEHDKQMRAQYLENGKEYTIARTYVEGWSTDVYLKEFEGIRFNSVLFVDVTEQSEALSQTHPDYYKYH